MRTTVVLALLIALTLILMAAPVEARRVRIPLPVAGLGGSEKLVRVIELPRVPELELPDGRYVDLGYKFNRGSGGEWIGYVGSDKNYVKLNPEQLEALLDAAGLTEPPPVPERNPGAGTDAAAQTAGALAADAGSNGIGFLLPMLAVDAAAYGGWRLLQKFAHRPPTNEAAIAFEKAQAYINAQATGGQTPLRARNTPPAIVPAEAPAAGPAFSRARSSASLQPRSQLQARSMAHSAAGAASFGRRA